MTKWAESYRSLYSLSFFFFFLPIVSVQLTMNIEEILPELFSSSSNEKRVYYCQRCLNHGLRFKRKNHKTECAFRLCICADCEMISRRRQLNSLLRQECSISPESPPLDTIDTSSQLTVSSCPSDEFPSLALSSPLLSSFPSSEDSSSGNIKERRPNCQRCAQHSTINRLKGHKRNCPFKECNCAKCMVVVERQKLMADQIKLRRKQKKEKMMMNEMECVPSPPVSHSSGEVAPPICTQCTQQALQYQQLMGMIDPTSNVDPIATLALILPLCPHKND